MNNNPPYIADTALIVKTLQPALMLLAENRYLAEVCCLVDTLLDRTQHPQLKDFIKALIGHTHARTMPYQHLIAAIAIPELSSSKKILNDKDTYNAICLIKSNIVNFYAVPENEVLFEIGDDDDFRKQYLDFIQSIVFNHVKLMAMLHDPEVSAMQANITSTSIYSVFATGNDFSAGELTDFCIDLASELETDIAPQFILEIIQICLGTGRRSQRNVRLFSYENCMIDLKVLLESFYQQSVSFPLTSIMGQVYENTLTDLRAPQSGCAASENPEPLGALLCTCLSVEKKKRTIWPKSQLVAQVEEKKNLIIVTAYSILLSGDRLVPQTLKGFAQELATLEPCDLDFIESSEQLLSLLAPILATCLAKKLRSATQAFWMATFPIRKTHPEPTVFEQICQKRGIPVDTFRKELIEKSRLITKLSPRGTFTVGHSPIPVSLEEQPQNDEVPYPLKDSLMDPLREKDPTLDALLSTLFPTLNVPLMSVHLFSNLADDHKFKIIQRDIKFITALQMLTEHIKKSGALPLTMYFKYAVSGILHRKKQIGDEEHPLSFPLTLLISEITVALTKNEIATICYASEFLPYSSPPKQLPDGTPNPVFLEYQVASQSKSIAHALYEASKEIMENYKPKARTNQQITKTPAAGAQQKLAMVFQQNAPSSKTSSGITTSQHQADCSRL